MLVLMTYTFKDLVGAFLEQGNPEVCVGCPRFDDFVGCLSQGQVVFGGHDVSQEISLLGGVESPEDQSYQLSVLFRRLGGCPLMAMGDFDTAEVAEHIQPGDCPPFDYVKAAQKAIKPEPVNPHQLVLM